MKCSSWFATRCPRWLPLIGLFVITFSLAIQHIANGQDDKEPGLRFRLSEEPKIATPTPAPTIAAPPSYALSDEATQNLLKRLPPIADAASDTKGFGVRESSLPPPRAGRVIDAPFPPSAIIDALVDPTAGPFEVLRFAPEGEVELATHLSVTFSQPMVAVTSNEDLSASPSSVKLSPQPAGKWRWIGTKTLLFEPAVRFPMATDYTVEIPAGVKSAVGDSLGAAKRWTFSTPPPQVKSSFPRNGPHSRNPLFFIEFDQRIEPESMLRKIRLNSSGRAWTLRLATGDEIWADENISRMVKAANKDYWIAFRAGAAQGDDPQNPLLPDEKYTCTVTPGAPSAEGPGVTTKGQSFSFSTHGPLIVKSHGCGYNNNCAPGSPFTIGFSNQLDLKAFDKSQIRVTPELPGMDALNYGDWIYIHGQSKGRTVYTLTLDASIRDIYGQTLGENKTLTFRVGEAMPTLAAPGAGCTVLDPYSQPKFSVFSVN